MKLNARFKKSLVLEVLRSSIASADAMCGRVMGPVRREWLEAIPMPDAQSRPISRRLMACSDSTTRPRSAPNPRVRGPPRPPARVTGVRPWFCLGTDFVSDAVVCAKRCLTVGARYSLVPPRATRGVASAPQRFSTWRSPRRLPKRHHSYQMGFMRHVTGSVKRNNVYTSITHFRRRLSCAALATCTISRPVISASVPGTPEARKADPR